MPEFIDLHTHTTASDGSYTPAELVRHAEECGLSAIAITDHDSADGLEEAHSACEALGVEVIDGIEIGADYAGEMHILGLFTDPYAAVLQGAMQELKVWRAQRNEDMIQKLCSIGVSIGRGEVLELSGGDMSSAGRVHMAHVIVQKGYTETLKEAFERYLGVGRAGYVPRRKFSPQKCIEIIKSSGGYAFLAHPILLGCGYDVLCEIIEELKGYGLDGIECYHSANTYEFSEMSAELCRANDLMICGGSDFHGANKPDVQLGRVGEGQYIEYDILSEIKRKIGRIE